MGRLFIEGQRITCIEQLAQASCSEKAFALAVLARHHLLLYREPSVSGKRPDFHVINTKRYGFNPKKRDGIIVEVTQTVKRELGKNAQKREQKDALDKSGVRYTFLTGESVARLKALHSL